MGSHPSPTLVLARVQLVAWPARERVSHGYDATRDFYRCDPAHAIVKVVTLAPPPAELDHVPHAETGKRMTRSPSGRAEVALRSADAAHSGGGRT